MEYRSRAAIFGAAIFFAAALSGCANPAAFGGSRLAVEQWGKARGFAALPASSTALPLLILARGTADDLLSVYIEGDGAPWPSPYHPPRDPTPERPVALALAAADPAPAAAYIGRPCQYLDAAALAGCPVRYWTSHRFSPEVVEGYQRALDLLKTRFDVKRLRLIGYSGGGVLAMLLAGTRDDVAQAITVASPVSVAEWTAWHGVSPLAGSLDPGAQPPPPIPVVHFVGERDRVVPAEVVAPFAARSGGMLRRVPDFDHECCWSRDWRRLLEETR